MIYLIDKVLPESYFVNNLRALSVDMAVFRDLLRMKLPELSQHLDALQRTANKESGGNDGLWQLHFGEVFGFSGSALQGDWHTGLPGQLNWHQ